MAIYDEFSNSFAYYSPPCLEYEKKFPSLPLLNLPLINAYYPLKLEQVFFRMTLSLISQYISVLPQTYNFYGDNLYGDK